MSLFPAYNAPAPNITEPIIDDKTTENWLENPSFAEIKKIEEPKTIKLNIDNTDKVNEKILKKHKRKKDKKRRRKEKTEISKESEFTGTEEFYIDKQSARGYLKVKTLYKPACPRYRKRLRIFGWNPYNNKRIYKRYFEIIQTTKEKTNDDNNRFEDETEFSLKTKELNESLNEDPNNAHKWIELIRHQDLNILKLTKVQLTERKINILDRSLKENPGNVILLQEYIDVIKFGYPNDEVSKILEKLISREPTSYCLWKALIQSTQCSMARCRAPDVLKIYERCMHIMYSKLGDDDIMLQLFKNCALFLRQSGLFEQFFALIKLALELNVTTNKFKNIKPLEKEQQQLVEYEEVILKSGLPMNEIWLRIEKLRQNYNFLPCPENSTCADPQRIIFNDDVCHYIYPLIKKENIFRLVIIILKLLKIPLPINTNILLNNDECPSEFDDIEQLQTIFLSLNLNPNSNECNIILLELIRDMNIGPSYINNNIGYEIYLNVITEILLICSECFQQNEQNNIFIILWMKFERIQLICDKLMDKLTDDKRKKLKNKIKNFLKIDNNRNVLNFYTEYALIEYNMNDMKKAENILLTSIKQCRNDLNCSKAELYYSYTVYVELLIREQSFIKAIKILTLLSLNLPLDNIDEYELTDNKKLMALTKFNDRCNKLIFIERNVIIMELEQYFLPDYFINLIKCKIFYYLLIKTKLETLSQIEILLKTFIEKNARHKFIRENLYELYLIIMDCNVGIDKNLSTNLLIMNILERGLNEFPNNLLLLKYCTILEGQMWFKLRTIMTKTSTVSITSIIFLIISAKYRYKKFGELMEIDNNPFNQISSNIDMNVQTYKYRIVNLLKNSTNTNMKIKKNSLLWRLYLRSLFDIEYDLEKCKNILYAALDECPWNKALYIDGSVYVPQELAQLQDLIIEKQLRIYALPEELEILRNDKF